MKSITVYLSHIKGMSKPYIAYIGAYGAYAIRDVDIAIHGNSYKEALVLALTEADITLMANGSHPLMMPGITYGDLNGEIVEIRFWKEIGLSDI